MAEVSNAVPELVVHVWLLHLPQSDNFARHIASCCKTKEMVRGPTFTLQLEKETKYELDTTWVLCLCKMKSHGQARFKYNGLGKKCTTQCFTASKNGNDSTIDQYGLLLEIDRNCS